MLGEFATQNVFERVVLFAADKWLRNFRYVCKHVVGQFASKPLIFFDGCNFRKGNSYVLAGSLIRNVEA